MTDERRDDREPPVRPGDHIGRYEVLAEVGHGGMGVVYRAKDLDLGRKVAIKFPWREFAEDREYRRRFIREARATSRLNHPNIVPVIEAIEQEGVPCLVLQYVEGENLQSLIVRNGRIETPRLIRFAEDLASALEAAHAADLLHRDVNPRNILVSPDGRALLTDFGLARVISRAEFESSATTRSPTLTSKGSVLGTPRYMSPEQALGKELDERSDIYSLGAVLYEMATGRPVFSERRAGELYDAIMHHEPEPLSRFTYEVPPELERIIRKAMAKRPDERYQRAADLLVDLRALRRQLDFESYTSSHGETAAGPPPRRRRPWLLIPFVLAAAAALWVVLRWDRDALPRAKPMRITREVSWEGEPAVSPDGCQVAYVSNAEGSFNIYVADLRGGDPLRVTDDPASDRYPFWFPGGTEIGFASDRSGDQGIWKTGRFGGGATLLLEGAKEPDLSPDGKRLVFSRLRPADGRNRIGMGVLDDPNEITWLTGGEDCLWDHRNPAWSPDGRAVCYEDVNSLWLVSPDEPGSCRRLTRGDPDDREPVWSPDGRFVYFASSREGTEAIWRVRVESGDVERVTMGTGPENHPSLSPDGKWLVYTTSASDRDVALLDRKTARLTSLAELGDDYMVTIAPDLSNLVFSSRRQSEDWDLWRLDMAGGMPEGRAVRLIDHPGNAAQPAYSPDGRSIAYLRIDETARDIWIVPAEGGKGKRFTENPATDLHPAWSPDGTRIAFSSPRDGLARIWVAGVAEGARTGDARPVSPENIAAYAPAWSPDGETIAFPGMSEGAVVGEVYLVPAAGGEARQLTNGAAAKRIHWDPSGDALLVSGLWDEDRTTLRTVPLDGSDPIPFDPKIDFGDRDAFGIFDLSSDGRFLIYRRENLRGDVWALHAESGSF